MKKQTLNQHFKNQKKRPAAVAAMEKLSTKEKEKPASKPKVLPETLKNNRGSVKRSRLDDSFDKPKDLELNKKPKVSKKSSKTKEKEEQSTPNNSISNDPRPSNFKVSTPYQMSLKTLGIMQAVLNKTKDSDADKEKNDLSLLNIRERRIDGENERATRGLSIESFDNKNEKSSEEAPPVSSRTLQAIQQLRLERKNRFIRETPQIRRRSESSFSMRFKYEELIGEERQLLMPLKYKILLQAFDNFDNTLNFFKLRKRVPVFEDLKQSYEFTYKQYIFFNYF